MHRCERVFATTFFLAAFAPLTTQAANTYYVAPTGGSDSAAGTEAAPFATFAKVQSAVAAGDTVYLRGGRYAITSGSSGCGGSQTAVSNAITLSKSGTAGSMIRYWAYPGETPIFDFSGLMDDCRVRGFEITGSWIHMKGIEVTGVTQRNNRNHESWAVYVDGGSNNIFEMMDAHHNMGPGFFLQRGGNNLFLNCDSHENEDVLTSNGDGQSADGFGCHPNRTSDTGNVFRGCRAWWNSDDNWDFINASASCTVENSWAWYAGYKPDALNGGKPVALSAGNGNGFKGGGYGMPPTLPSGTIPLHIIRMNAAFYNKAAGVYANHSPVSVYFYNNTSYNNGSDFDMLGVASDGSTSISVGILRNNLAFTGTLTSDIGLGGGLIDDQYNSWDSNMGLTVTAADFESTSFSPPASCPAPYSAGGTVCVSPTDKTSFAGMASARQADGSLPVLPFLRLAAGSKLIDKGRDVGLPFVGLAPDLGAFEYGGSTGNGSGGATGTGGATTGRGGATTATGGAGTGGRTGGTGAGGAGGGATSNTGGTRTGGALDGGGAGAGRSGSGGVNGGTAGLDAGGGTAGVDGAGNAGSTSASTADSGGGSGGFASAGGGGSSAVSGDQTATKAATGGTAGSAARNAAQSGCSCRIGDRSDTGGTPVLLLLLVLAERPAATRAARARRLGRMAARPAQGRARANDAPGEQL